MRVHFIPVEAKPHLMLASNAENMARIMDGEQIMAIPTNIHTLLSGNVVEWARIEFKESWKPEASLKTITAFANDLDNWGGGYLVIGVADDNGRPKFPVKGLNLSEIDNIQKDLLNKCKLIEPEYCLLWLRWITTIIPNWLLSGVLAERFVRIEVPPLSHTIRERLLLQENPYIGSGKWPVQSDLLLRK